MHSSKANDSANSSQNQTPPNDVDPDRKVTEHTAAKRRTRPPLRYTEDFETPTTVQLNVIGVVRSPYKVSNG